MQFYQELETIVQLAPPQEKIKRFKTFYEAYKKGALGFCEEASTPLVFQKPSYEPFCTVVSPRDVPKRSRLDTREGQINLLHAIAHIEYSAIDLALDICYRFRDMPGEFYNDWLEVADDEVRHFLMIESILNDLGASYGDIAVHESLFEASRKTAHSLLDRLAVIPRYLEANGLDATPQILKKLKTLPESMMLNNIKFALELILEEEIEHVHKGDIWFAYECRRSGKDKSIYIDIINKYYPQGFSKLKSLNKEARLQAGFSCNEMQKMVKKKVC